MEPAELGKRREGVVLRFFDDHLCQVPDCLQGRMEASTDYSRSLRRTATVLPAGRRVAAIDNEGAVVERVGA